MFRRSRLFDASYTTVADGPLAGLHRQHLGAGSHPRLGRRHSRPAHPGLRHVGRRRTADDRVLIDPDDLVRRATAIRANWLWVISGTGAGQARAISWASANVAYAVTVNAGGSGYSVGQYLKVTGGTLDTPGAAVILKVTSVSSGAITGLSHRLGRLLHSDAGHVGGSDDVHHRLLGWLLYGQHLVGSRALARTRPGDRGGRDLCLRGRKRHADAR